MFTRIALAIFTRLLACIAKCVIDRLFTRYSNNRLVKDVGDDKESIKYFLVTSSCRVGHYSILTM